MTADRIEALLADKGYDADTIRNELAKADIEAVILAKRNRR
jgi:IS5 family transposase